MSVQNQKRVIIGKRVKRDKDNLYAMINLSALKKAMQDLKGSSLKMWLYFNKNQDNFSFDLSVSDCKNWGIKKDSYYSGVADLIDKGYLVPGREGSNTYVFFENVSSGNQIKDYSKFEIQDWENQKTESELQINQSENPERNNTNNTFIVQNNTPATDKEIQMLKDLERMCILGFYQGDDIERIEELLKKNRGAAPSEKIEKMSPAERRELEEYWTKYYGTLN